ncbi:hypothetical protein FOZ61_008037 [Perkinsus olseni]|uniref:WW domain-containing protein n=1 Tax=Perkinsus olseni TaxID=32597 RepID=A0A7J6M814_PEROL|nr:hypothetical protein FOZ61_008037 [Perkinsus olseni]KAF4675764.1 hypothetical protein FOL46_000090 [Perkinsus olseni]
MTAATATSAIATQSRADEVLAVTTKDPPIEKPNPEEVRDYALWLGLTDDDRDLFWIAVQALTTPIPEPWVQCQTASGDVFFHNSKTKESVWDHPFDSFYQQAVTKYKKGKCNRKELAELLSQPWLLEGLHKHRASSAKPAAGARDYKNGRRDERTPAYPCLETTNVNDNNNRAEKEEEERLKSVMAWAEHAVTSSSDSETEQRRQKRSSDGEESQRLFTTRDTKMDDGGQVFAELEEMREEVQRVKQKLADDVSEFLAGVNEEISQLANAQERVDQSVHDCKVELERTKEDLTRTREVIRAASQTRESSDAAITMQGTEEEARIESLRTALQQTNDEVASSESVVEAYRTEATELRARLTEARDFVAALAEEESSTRGMMAEKETLAKSVSEEVHRFRGMLRAERSRRGLGRVCSGKAPDAAADVLERTEPALPAVKRHTYWDELLDKDLLPPPPPEFSPPKPSKPGQNSAVGLTSAQPSPISLHDEELPELAEVMAFSEEPVTGSGEDPW